uniref:Uncharacterized protein n=1 Tax=Sphenodon punctatus TaxID=8508 RepID=A0A8D0GIQ5_SPHPU
MRDRLELHGQMALNGGGVSPSVSREPLSVGSGGGSRDALLINSRRSPEKAASLQTVRVPRSNILDSFLPQMAHANDELRREMATVQSQQFDIENLKSALEKVIEMNVALVELSGSETEEETSEDSSDSDEDDSANEELSIDNLKLPIQKREKGKIEILDILVASSQKKI